MGRAMCMVEALQDQSQHLPRCVKAENEEERDPQGFRATEGVPAATRGKGHLATSQWL